MTKTHKPQPGNGTLQPDLKNNLDELQRGMGSSSDLIFKELTNNLGWTGALLFIDGLADSVAIHHAIQDFLHIQSRNTSEIHESPVSFLSSKVITAGNTNILSHSNEIYASLLSGGIILLLDGSTECLSITAEGWKDRSVSEPTSQSVVRGPMEAFTENIRTNTTLVRRKIKDPRLWVQELKIGDVTQTNVAVMHIEGLAEQHIVDEVMERLSRIDIDGILESGYVESFIQDKIYTPFPLIYNTERPDTIAAGLLEGKVAILVDGTPFVLLVPALFVQFFQSAEDYYQRADISTLLRMLRYISFFIAMLAPSIYIAITTFHQEMLPTGLLINLAAQREGVPFPAFVEAVLMEITFEILREAGVRMPKTVGQAVSIVGTLVIGQAAVDAGIVSAAMVIIVSITAISSFVIPAVNFSITVRMLRFPLMGLSASFGLLGILLGMIIIVLHLGTIKSFGVHYLHTFAPFNWRDQKDALFRAPWVWMKTRPSSTGKLNRFRQNPRHWPTGNNKGGSGS